VEVVGFTESAPNLVRRAIRKGDRVIAVDSSLGDQMWPVSTVEGVISACTSRLPGQQVTLRFERPEAVMALFEEEADAEATRTLMVSTTIEQEQVASTSNDQQQQQLLKRCRDILRRYALEEQDLANSKPLAAGAKFVGKYGVPALVADRVMEALAKAAASLDSVTLSMTMDAYLSCGQADKAISAFEAAVGVSGDGSSNAPTSDTKIQANLAALNVYTISSLLKAHAMNRDLKSVRRVVAAMEGRGGEKISGLEAASWPGAGAGGTIKPDTQCYNIAISAASKAGAAEGLQLVMKLFDSLEEPSIVFRRSANTAGTKPEKNAVTYNAVIGALTMAGKYDDAFSIFFNMKRVGLKPDKFTYTSLLKACVYDGDLQELLIDMQDQGVKRDVVMYNTMVQTLCDDGRLAEAKTLITQMEGKGVDPDSRTYGILMKGLLRANKPGACLALFEAACNNKQTSAITENVFLYTTAVTAASKLGDHDRALELVSRMTALGIKPNLKTLTALMGACMANDRPDLAAEIYKKIDAPDGYAMAQGLQAFCRSGDLKAAAQLLSTQKRGSRSLSGKELMTGYETIVITAVESGDYSTARRMFTELLEKSYIPSKAMLRNIIGAMGLLEQGKLVLEYVERDPEHFQFLLFLIDAIERRNMAVDAFLYAATIACGNQIGGKQREVASLLIKSKSAFGAAIAVEVEENTLSEALAVQWEEVALKDELLKKLKTNSALLPRLEVSVGKRDTRAVFFAEKFMSRPRPVQEKIPITAP
jgi:pentatricopeptide repeat protein